METPTNDPLLVQAAGMSAQGNADEARRLLAAYHQSHTTHTVDDAFLAAVVHHQLHDFDTAGRLVYMAAEAIGAPLPFRTESPTGRQPWRRRDFPFRTPYAWDIYKYYCQMRSINIGGIDIYYTADLYGEGDRLGMYYLLHLPRFVRTVGRGYEWCSGPAFIGFALLNYGLCETLCLADVNPKALDAARYTMLMNQIPADRVSFYLSDGLKAIPPEEKWDLVVGSPPMAADMANKYPGPQRLSYDLGWQLHREFYQSLGAHLNPGAIVSILEAKVHSQPATFQEMISAGGLRVLDISTNSMSLDVYAITMQR